MRIYCYIVVEKLFSCFLKTGLTVSQNCNRKERFGLISCKSSTAKYYSKIIRTTFTIITSERFFFQCTFLGYWTVSWVLGLLVHRCAWYFIFRFVITWSNSTTLKLKNKFFFFISWQKKKMLEVKFVKSTKSIPIKRYGKEIRITIDFALAFIWLLWDSTFSFMFAL